MVTKYYFFKIQISSEFFWPNPKGPIPSQYLKLRELTFSSPIIAIQNPMPNSGMSTSPRDTRWRNAEESTMKNSNIFLYELFIVSKNKISVEINILRQETKNIYLACINNLTFHHMFKRMLLMIPDFF
mgnify:CR=1 FL=1